MFNRLKEKGSLMVDKALADGEGVKDLANLINLENDIVSKVPDSIKLEKDAAFWFLQLATKECKEFEEPVKQLNESIRLAGAAAEAYKKAREAEISALKEILERYKSSEKVEKAFHAAEKKKSKAQPPNVQAAEAEYNEAKQRSDADRADLATYSKQHIKNALVLRHKAMLDYYLEAAKQAQAQYDIVNSLDGEAVHGAVPSGAYEHHE